MAEPDQEQFCALCETIRDRAWQFGSSRYCIACIADCVDSRMNDLAERWPPVLEHEVIDIERFENLVPEALAIQWRLMHEWRRIPNSANRIFCAHLSQGGNERCNDFVGRRLSWAEHQHHEVGICQVCGLGTCLRCARPTAGEGGGEGADLNDRCTQTEEMIAEQADREGQSEAVGVAYQICPNPECRRQVNQLGGCNEMNCVCGRVFCYICGRGEPDIDRRAHWQGPSGCPRFNRPDGSAGYDRWEFNPPNQDTHHFEDLNPGGGDRWRSMLERATATDEEFRIQNRGNYQLGGDFYNAWMQRLVVAARHMLIMLHNGLPYGGNTSEERVERLHRRIRFEHHGLYFRYGLMVMRRALAEDVEIPGGNDLYESLSPYSRPLRFRHNAVPDMFVDRSAEWTRFRAVVEDQLRIQYSQIHVLETLDANEHQRGTWTRALLEPVSRMLTIFERHWDTEAFSLSDSASLRNELETMRETLRSLNEQPDRTHEFRESGSEQRAVHGMAELFANRLLGYGNDYVDEWSNDAIGDYRFTMIWAEDIIDAIDVEQANLYLTHPHDMPERVPELYRELNGFLRIVMNVITNPEGAPGISNHNLGDLRRRLAHYTEVQESGFVQITTGTGPLRPLFLRMAQVMQRIDRDNVDRIISARSSVSSNADNVLEEDIQLIDNEYTTALQNAARGEHNLLFGVQIDILEALRRVGARLAQPNRLPTDRNQEDFDSLQRQVIARRSGRLQAWAGSENEGRIARIMQRMVDRALDNREINRNPARQRRAENLRPLRHRLQEADVLVRDRDDPVYVTAFHQALTMDVDRWQAIGGSTDDGIHLLEFLHNLGQAALWHALPPQLRGEEILDRLHDQRVLADRFDVENTVIGTLRNFPRLFGIWEIVRAWEPPEH